MKNKVGMVLFGVGFCGECLSIMCLDSEAWKGAIVSMIIFGLVAVIGYLVTDIDEVLEDGGLMKIRESREVQERKARNREIVWRTWLATK